MKRIFTIVVLMMLLHTLSIPAQTFYKTFGTGTTTEYGSAIAIAPNGKIVIGGSMNNFCFVSLLDSTGSIVLWTRKFTLDSSYVNQVSSIEITPDNYIIGTTDVLCSTPKFCGTGYFKIDFSGNFYFNKTVVSNNNKFTLKKIFPISSSSYVGVGMNYTSSGTHADWKFLKINSSTGAVTYQSGLIDEEHAGLPGYLDDIFSTTTLHNNYFYFSGRIYAGGTGAESMRPNIVKMDTNFTVVWSNFYFKDENSSARIYPFDLEAYDDSIIVTYAGDMNGTGPAFSCGLIKLKTDGTVLWQKNLDLSNSSNDHPSRVMVTSDGYLIFGVSNFLSVGNRDFFLIKTNRNGQVIWSKTIGTSSLEQAASISCGAAQLYNGYIYFTGETNAGNNKIVVGNVTLNGSVSCISETSQTIANTTIPNYQQANTQRVELPNTISVASVPTYPTNLTNNCFSFSLGVDTILCSPINFTLQVPTIAGALYEWNTGDSSNVITVQDSGLYYLKITSNCCSFVDSIRISKSLPLQKNQLIILCAGDSLQVGNNYHSFAGNYIDTISTNFGCDSIVKTQLALYPTHFALSKTLCKGDSIYFNSNYLQASGIYYDTLSSVLGCDSIVSLNLQIQETGQLSVTGDTLLCKGDSTILIAHGALTYQWSPQNSLDEIDANTVMAAPSSNTIYTLIGKNGFCFDTTTISISVLNNPKINPLYSISPCLLNVQFQNQNPSIQTCNWNFGDGYLSELCNAVHQYSAEGNYTINLNVEFNNGCKQDTSFTLKVSKDEGEGKITQSNYFTPNSDGVDDIFYFSNGIACDYISFEIYSVLGQFIYKSTAVEKGWNGSNQGGAICTFGTYFYIVKTATKNYFGFVELIR
ncbi:MAG TPA: gliding motility-associated C-terminal domain-containing protein [Bacteroidia bacterium]|nr:gliding motility-associated C-terminal domain-containing protein [Bacteroidia bacterium]HRH08571.1 gliding motility-associated C-terminal domain-containing protein [Bacteroidia bacterium]